MDPQSDPTPAPGRLPHLPALDGVRALALLGVLGFHAGFTWLRGGYLPLTAFFVLSGFLITSILLIEHEGSGRIDRKTFWIRRARRLVPGALMGLAVAAASVYATGAELPRFKGDALSSLVWMTNWRFIANGQSYEDLFTDPSPLQHYWSLAIEEQFYLVLPLLAGALLVRRGRSRGRARQSRWPFVVTVAGLAVASVVTMGVLHQPGDEPLRTYYGTDTRAAELLIGVLLATVMIGRDGLRRLTGPARAATEVVGVVGLVGSVALWCSVRQYDDWLFEGGLAAVALLSAAVVLAASQTGTLVSRLLGLWPLAALGRISYGAYLYHWPLFLWISPERTGLDTGPLFAVRMAATIALATLSYRYVEQPIRQGRLPKPVAPLAWANGAVGVMAIVALVVAIVPQTDSPDEITLAAEGVVVQAAPPPPPPPAPGDVTATSAPVAVPSADATTPGSVAAQAGGTSTSQQGRPRSNGGGAAAPAGPSGSPGTTAGPSAEPGAPTQPGPGPGSAPAPGPAPAPAPAPTTPGTTAPPPPPPKPKPARVLVLGDSLAQNFAVGLDLRSRQTGDMVVWNRGVSGCALGRGGYRWGGAQYPASCSWWASSQARSEIDRFKPTVVLVVAGLNDIVDRRRDEWGSNYIGPGDPRFDTWLLSEYQAVVDAMGRNGVPVVWIPPPCVNWSAGWDDMVGADHNGERRRFHHNRTTIPALSNTRTVHIGDVESQLCPGGRFDPNAMGIENSRPDGLHLVNEASIALAERWLAPLLFAKQR